MLPLKMKPLLRKGISHSSRLYSKVSAAGLAELADLTEVTTSAARVAYIWNAVIETTQKGFLEILDPESSVFDRYV